VGEQLSAPLRISCPPLRTLRQGAMHPPAPSSPSLLGAFTTNPAIRVVRGGEGRRSYSLPPASAERDLAHLSRDTFSVSQDAWFLLDLLGPRGAFTRPRRPLTSCLVTRRHARPTSVSTDALSLAARAGEQ